MAVEGHGVSDLENRTAAGFGGHLGRKLFALLLEIGEANLDQFVVVESLVKGCKELFGKAVVTDVNDRFEKLRAAFEFTRSGWSHAKKGLLIFSSATVVSGPCPGHRIVESSRPRISRRIVARASG